MSEHIPTSANPYRKRVLLAISPIMLNEIDQLAVDERRTRSDLMRQAIREYMERKQDRQAVLLQAQLAHAGVA